MPDINRILVGLGFGDWTETILRTAASLSDLYNAPLTAIYSDPFEPPVYLSVARSQRDLEERKTAARRHLEETVARVLGNGTAYETRLVERRPADGILRTSREIGADLIVLGAHRRSGLRRRLMGAVPEKVLTRTEIPLLTIRDFDGQSIPPFRSILVPTNFTEVAQESMAYASDLAERYEASLTVMTSLEESDLAGGANADSTRAARAVQLARWAEEHGAAMVSQTTVVRTGQASREILRMAEAGKHDLIVIGAAHKPLLESTVFGTTSLRVMRHAKCSVLSIVRTL